MACQRGIRILHLRMAANSANGIVLARALEKHPAVTRFEYPGLERHASYGTARENLNDGFEVCSASRSGEAKKAASEFIERLEIVELVPSLPSPSTTISHPTQTSHRSFTEEQRQSAGISGGLVRLSAGIEPVEPVWSVISNALGSLGLAN